MPASTSSPIAAIAQRLDAPAALAPDQCRSLLDYLAQVADPRHRRGRRHTLVTVLAVAVCAVLTGARSLAAIGEWAADAPDQVLAALGVRRDPLCRVWRLAGRDLFWWLTHLGAMRVSVDSRLGRRASRREFIIGTNRRKLKGAGVRFRPRLVDAAGRTVRFADHSTLEDVGVVVWATGYRSDHAWIHIPGVVREGHVVHRRGVTEVPGLYFLGLSWQHTRGSALLGFVNDDATYLADRIATRHQAAMSANAGVTPQPSS